MHGPNKQPCLVKLLGFQLLKNFSPTFWKFFEKFQIAQNGPPFWQGEFLKFLGRFTVKYELSAAKN